jgi:hypothetical protein
VIKIIKTIINVEYFTNATVSLSSKIRVINPLYARGESLDVLFMIKNHFQLRLINVTIVARVSLLGRGISEII